MLVVLDKAYFTRFWTCYESWLSCHTASSAKAGLELVEAHRARAFFLPILTATKDDVTTFRKQWLQTNPEAAFVKLSSPDIVVTNGSDKQQQLEVLRKLPAHMSHLCRLADLQEAGVMNIKLPVCLRRRRLSRGGRFPRLLRQRIQCSPRTLLP